VLPRFQPTSKGEEGWFLCGFAQHSGPTGSGTGDTHASGQGLPFIRPLLHPFMRGLQARLRTFPEDHTLGTRRGEMILIERGGQKGRIEISLHRANAAGTLVPPHRERFFDTGTAAMAELRELGCSCRNFDQGAARTCNGASQLFYKHPWCSKPHTLTKLLLPRFIRYLFQDDDIASRHNLMHEAPM